MNVIKKHVFIAATLVLSACSKQSGSLSANDTSGKGLNGDWEWVRTDGGLANHIHDTPLSTGKQVVLRIASDSTYAVYTNNAMTATGTYSLESRTCAHDHTAKTYIRFSSIQGMMVEKIDGESLQLSDESIDGLTSIYKRLDENIK